MADPQPSPDETPGTVVDPAVLAERRARRAELAEDSLLDRAQGAEREAEELRAQLAIVERGLDAAADERDRLREELAQRERDLVAARQREEAERRRRDEVQIDGDTDRRVLEAQVADLRVRVGAAEARAAELAADVHRLQAEADAARREVERERAARRRLEAGAEDVAALSRALESRRDDVTQHMVALEHRAEALEGSLAAEASARQQAQAELVAERERAEAEITLLQHELDRRAEIHDAVQEQLLALGAEVGRVRESAEDDAARRTAAEGVLAEVTQTAARLRTALTELERQRDEAQGQLERSRAALAGRDDDLVRAQADLGAARAELDLVRADAARQALALQEAERTIVTVRAAADDLRAQLDAERTERESLALRLAASEEELHRRLEQERGVFEAKILDVERTVIALRGRLAEAAGDLERELAQERAAREAAEAALATHRQAAEAERARLERVHAAALADLAAARDAAVRTAETVRAEVAAELTAAQAAAAAERRRADDAAEQARLQAAVEVAAEREEAARRLLAEQARAEAERERADASTQLAENVRSDRDRLAEELAGRAALDEQVRATLDTLRTQLDDVRGQSEARAAREAAVEALVADLVGTAAALREGFDRELATMRVQLEAYASAAAGAGEEAGDAPVAVLAGLEASVVRLSDDLAAEQSARLAAEEALRALESGPAAPEDVEHLRAGLEQEVAARRAAEEDARAAVTALTAAERELALLRREHGTDRDEAQALMEDLALAARRLREEPPAPGTPPAVDEPAGDPEWGAPPPRREPAAAAPVDPEVLSAPAAPPAAPVAHVGDAGAEEAAPALVRPHIVAPGDRREVAWLLPALRRLAAEDPVLAAAALVALLPAQANILARELAYDLTISGHGTWRVALGPGTAHVAPPTREAGSAPLVVVGDLDAVAPLAAGGARRRLPGVEVVGPRRALRRVIKARKAPVSLADLHAGGVRPQPSVLLALLVAAVPAAWTAGHEFDVDYFVPGDRGGLWRVSVRHGRAPVLTAPCDEDPAPDATVRIAAEALLPLLAALPLPPGERLLISGDVTCARRLGGWFAQAQGLAPEPV